MFGSFQSISAANRPFIIEPALPPFDQKRPPKLTRLACINCRSSKLKCSGDPKGCQRCEVKQIECCYPRPPIGRRNVKRSQPHALPSKALSSKAASQASHSPSSLVRPRSSPETPPNDIQLYSMGHASPREIPYRNTENWLSQRRYGVDMSENISEYLQGKELQDVEDWQSPVPAITTPRSVPMGTDTTRSPTTSRGAEQGHTGGIPLEAAMMCFCYSDAIATFDNIQTSLVWKPHGITTPSELLQCQKQSLSECENLLSCRSCVSQSKYITLIIVMCEYLLASMEGGCCIQAWCRQWNGAELSEPNDDRQQGGRRDRVVGEETSDRPGQETNKVVIGRWQLDSDDQFSVIQGLFSTRVVRLSNIVTKLGKVANEHHWLNQGRRIQDIRDRCHSLSRQLRVDAECLAR